MTATNLMEIFYILDEFRQYFVPKVKNVSP